MATTICARRLQKEYMNIKKTPVENIEVHPLEDNILEWHYCIFGTKGTLYEGGYYHGVLKFPREYPLKPPSVLMHTPNGRFKTHTRLCLSMSDYHPETWNPMWSVSTILMGLYSFMLEETSTLGSIRTPKEQNEKGSIIQRLRASPFIASKDTGEEASKRVTGSKLQGSAVSRNFPPSSGEVSWTKREGEGSTGAGSADEWRSTRKSWPISLSRCWSCAPKNRRSWFPCCGSWGFRLHLGCLHSELPCKDYLADVLSVYCSFIFFCVFQL